MTFSLPRQRKWRPSSQCLMVPKGCSLVCCRSFCLRTSLRMNTMTRFSARFDFPKLLCGECWITSEIGWQRETRVAVHNHGHIDAVAPDVDVLRFPRIGAAVGTASAGLPAGVDGSVPRVLFPEQLPAHGAGHRAVPVMDEAAHLPQQLHLHADVRVFIAVRQHAGAETGLNVLRFLGGLLRRARYPSRRNPARTPAPPGPGWIPRPRPRR